MKIGVISDTHNFLDPRIPQLFKGVKHILHAGDIGQPDILNQLRALAPVTAVCGNTDEPVFHFPLTATVELGGVKFLLQHIVNPLLWTTHLETRIQEEQPNIVVFGHTHKPCDQVVEDVRFFNPGYAGKARFNLKRSVAILELRDLKAVSRYFELG